MSKICLNYTISILSGLLVLFLMSALGFIVNLPISFVYLPLSIICGFVIFLYLSNKENFSIKSKVAQIIVFLDFILIAGVLCYLIPDLSFDGRTYHQAMIILLKSGLNPIYDNVANFIAIQKYQFTSSEIYVENFLKFFEIIGANIYICFNKIELTKITNFVLMFCGFCYTFYSLKNFNLSDKVSLVFSIIFIYNPVCVYQMLSNYVDASFYYLFLLLIFGLINYVRNFDEKLSLFVISSSFVMLSNIKLTGLFLSVIFCGLFVIFYRKKALLLTIVTSIVLVLITGINPYFTNLAHGRNVFYPFVQNGDYINANREFMITSYPPKFEKWNSFHKFFYSTFASSKNISQLLNQDLKPTLKLPFTKNGDEPFIYYDMRLGGFGYLFSGILCLSIILGAFLRFKDKENKKIFLILLFGILFSIFINQEAWWARFIPQFWSLPIIVCLFYFINEQTDFRQLIFVYLTMFCCVLNSLIINYQNFDNLLKDTKEYNNYIKTLANPLFVNKKLFMFDKRYETLPVKLQEKGIEVIIVDE